ncbi:putative Glucose-methanol-choline oxidoreductase N-terminal domain-containing protein [Seiridium cardinale]|uniref:Glucose-methanol-choline oxidoreductase N-terminal domain-containing protein n=1 Tax=Seiridium cardinale TaxID=138064 RepID=A0ABR2XGR5_9PEZI
MPADKFDFIIIGAGPSGSSLASRLAHQKSKPSVLLLEAGGKNDDPAFAIASERHLFWAKNGLQLDYGYKTIPQTALNGRQLSYHRGKGLGGSSATNLGLWDYGSKPEYDEWARLVGSSDWLWENVSQRMKKLENHCDATPSKFHKYVHAEPGSHGTGGPVNVQLGSAWDKFLPRILEAVEDHGFALNPDVNSDQCIGFGIPPSTVVGASRVTAANAYLTDRPENLTILTHSTAARIIFENKRAIGVEVVQDSHYANKEVFLCSGSIDTPKLLLLSGVGPAEQLATLGIPVILDQPAIGQNLNDHPMIRIAAKVDMVAADLPIHEEVHTGIRKEGLEKQVTPVSEDVVGTCHGYCKLDLASCPEFKDIDPTMQKHLSDPLTPAFELVSRITPIPQAEGFLWNATVVIMNSLSRGRVFLRSRNVNDPPEVDLNFLAEPIDIWATTAAVRESVRLLTDSKVIPTDGLAVGPKSCNNVDILEFIRSNLSHLWHACGTIKMGKESDPSTCVTPDFRVVGLSGLRVVDMSVVPIIPSNHTQSTAYLIGETAADKIIAEYNLDI